MTHHTEMLTVLRALLVLPYALVAGSLGGTPFARARFGEFRVLPDGRALLVGLADEHLQALLAAPNPPAR